VNRDDPNDNQPGQQAPSGLMAKRDYYDILGVPRNASADQIKAAHRKLVRKFHPDVNKGDRSAEERFKEVQEAYDVLSDPTRRGNYDQFGHAGVAGGTGYGPDMYEHFRRTAGGGRTRGSGDAHVEEIDPSDFGNGQFHDIFEQLFGSRGPFGRGPRRGAGAGAAPPPGRGSDVDYPVTISFTEAARGSSVPIQIARDGRVETIEVKIPAGVKEGSRVRVKGRGQSSGGEPGDLFIVVSVRPHEFFRRDGLDLLMDLPISLYEAIEGARVTVPTLDGPVQISVPPGTSSGSKLRIRERGVHRGQEKGDQLCVIKIVVPKNLPEEDRAAIAALSKKHPIHARADVPWKV
jgi:DnaJ-class molecular chaperone